MVINHENLNTGNKIMTVRELRQALFAIENQESTVVFLSDKFDVELEVKNIETRPKEWVDEILEECDPADFLDHSHYKANVDAHERSRTDTIVFLR